MQDFGAKERNPDLITGQGFRNKEIGEKLFISEQTVKNHLHNIFDKLGVSDRLELALYAIHRTVWEYNHTRIHLALRMPPKSFAEQQRNLVENYSKERGA